MHLEFSTLEKNQVYPQTSHHRAFITILANNTSVLLLEQRFKQGLQM